MVVFDRPLGSPADVKELEYVSGLHQTACQVRVDGSITATDISLYLKSRFGLNVDEETVTQTILQGMGGSANDGEVIDLMEMTTILLIPYFVKAAKLQKGQTLPDGVQSPSPHTLKHVCQMMLHDVHIDQDEDGLADAEPILNVPLIQHLLRSYGEEDLAADETLCQQMLDQMTGHSVFNADALAQALTHDVHLYDIENEVRYSSLYHDVFQQEKSAAGAGAGQPTSQKVNDPKEHNTSSNKDDNIPDTAPKLSHTYTAPAIDSTAGTYRSKTLLICVWAGALFSYFASPVRREEAADCEPYVIGGTWSDNWDTMGCKTSESIIFWMIVFISLCCFGMFWVGCGSCGNQKDHVHCWKPTLGGLFLFVMVVLTFWEENIDVTSADEQYLRVVALILACIVIALHTLHCCEICAKEGSPRKERLRRMAFQDEVNLKSAIFYKINRMVDNAVDIHHSDDKQHIVKTCFGHALHVFSKHHKTEKVGGLVWAWKRIFTGAIFCEEGIWYSARLIAANVSQYIVCLYMWLAGVYWTGYVSDHYGDEDTKEAMREEAERIIWAQVNEDQVDAYSVEIASYMGAFLAELNTSGLVETNCNGFASTGAQVLQQTCQGFLGCNYADAQVQAETFCALMKIPDLQPEDQFTLLDGAGLNATLVIEQVRAAMEQSVEDSIDSLYPNEQYMLTLPMAVMTVVAVLTSLYLAISYLPSITSTTLQLRSGVIPTLSDKKLNQYRAAPDTVTLLTGSLFWGCLFAGLIVGGLIGLVVFLVLWQGSIYYVQRLVAILIGIVIIALIRVGVMCYGRAKYFQSFYRKKPAAANIYFLAMEWANFALTAGFVFVRLIKLLIVAGLSVGRIDTRFLAKGVGELGPLELDPFPTIHMRDIMSHDAHRHPYIEAMGTIYLMKLRYGRSFCSNAGSCWRLIFVYALMPWMQKYRIFDAPGNKMIDEDGNEVLDDTEVSNHLRELDMAMANVTSVNRSTRFAPRMLTTQNGKDIKDQTIIRLRRENEELREKLLKFEAKFGAVDDGK